MTYEAVDAVPNGGDTRRNATTSPGHPTLPPLPNLPEPAPAVAGVAMIALPVASGAGALVVALGRPGSAMAIGSLVVLVASIAVGVLLFVGQRQGTAARITRQRRRYLDVVEAVDTRLLGEVERRRTAEAGRPPGPAGIDGAVATVRLGLVTLTRPVPAPPPAADGLLETDPVCAAAVADLRTRRGTAHDMPVDLTLSALRRLTVDGPGDTGDALLRRLVLDLARDLPPRRLAIVVTGARSHPWVRWLPHCSLGVVLGRADRSLRADLADPVDDPMPDLLAAPDLEAILCVHLDDGPPGIGSVHHRTVGDDARTVLWSRTTRPARVDQAETGTRLEVGSDWRLTVRVPGAPPASGRATGVGSDEARMLARDIAHRWTSGSGAGDHTVARRVTSDPRDTARASPSDASHHLRVVIGRRPGGPAVELDLKDAAQNGMGPHGLVVGATGSGKSELLRGLTLRLVERHEPDELVLLLVDYKGGSTFAPFAGLPHVAGLLTNLAGDQHLTERFATALRGESARRQAVLAAAGVSDVAALRRLPDPPHRLPTMLVVVDEYSELLAAHPDLADLFTGLGRIGRSLGLHLLLATQRLDPGRSRGVDTHLSYKVVLRTFTAAESQELLGSTAAFTLPRSPGEALLVTAGEAPVRFRIDPCALPPPVSAAVQVGGTRPRPFPDPSGVDGRLSRLARLLDDSGAGGEVTPCADGDPLATAVAAVQVRLANQQGTTARPVWLPPLPERIALGAVPEGPESVEGLRPALCLGVVDRPATQEQTRLSWTPVHHPNLVVSGTGRSGRSSALLTVVAAAAAGAPGTVEVYGVALGGATMLTALDWPHVVGVAGADDPDLAERLLRLVAGEIDRRERPCDREGPPGAGAAMPPLVLLVVDDWAPVGALDGEVDRLIADIAARGPAVGIATAVATAAGTVLRGRVAGAFGTRIELRPADAFESAIDRRLAASLPAGVPGRALVVDGIAQLAAPPDPTGPEPFTIELHRRWVDHAVRRRHPLPDRVELGQIRPRRTGGPGAARSSGDPGAAGRLDRTAGQQGPTAVEIALGVEERGGPAVSHRLGRPDAHLVILGDPGSGRTMMLRSIAHQLADDGGPPVVLVGIDLRGDLLSAEPGIGWATAARRLDQVGPVVSDVLRYLTGPQDPTASDPTSAAGPPGPDLSGPRPAGSGQHGSGPGCWPPGGPPVSPVPALTRRRAPVVVLVDDEELLTGGVGHPLAPLLSAARSGADLGLHLVVSRSSGGFGRARFEPLHQMLSDLGTPTLLLSSSPEEGRLTHRLLPRPLPPGRAQWAVRGRPRRLLQTPIPVDPAGRRITTRTDAGAAAPDAAPTVQ